MISRYTYTSHFNIYIYIYISNYTCTLRLDWNCNCKAIQTYNKRTSYTFLNSIINEKHRIGESSWSLCETRGKETRPLFNENLISISSGAAWTMHGFVRTKENAQPWMNLRVDYNLKINSSLPLCTRSRHVKLEKFICAWKFNFPPFSNFK